MTVRPLSKPLFTSQPERTLWWCDECGETVTSDHECQVPARQEAS